MTFQESGNKDHEVALRHTDSMLLLLLLGAWASGRSGGGGGGDGGDGGIKSSDNRRGWMLQYAGIP
jgi:hypothetical protein